MGILLKHTEKKFELDAAHTWFLGLDFSKQEELFDKYATEQHLTVQEGMTGKQIIEYIYQQEKPNQ